MNNLDQKTAELVDYLDLLFNRFIFVQAKPLTGLADLNKQDIKTIMFLGKHSPVIMREIAEHMQLVSSAITAIVDKLVQKQLVRRIRTDVDRRLVKVELTKAGHKIYEVKLDDLKRLGHGILSMLDETEQDELLRLFRKISEKVNDLEVTSP